MTEVPLTSGQIRELRRRLGLRPGDYLSAEALLLMVETARVIEDAAERLALGQDGADDDG
jgi:hypothetical protein